MMKRLNYFQIHKNKRPRKIKRNKLKQSYIPLIASIMAMSTIQIATIQNSPFIHPFQKAIKMCLVAFDHAIAIAAVMEKMNNINPKKLYYESRFQKSSSRN